MKKMKSLLRDTPPSAHVPPPLVIPPSGQPVGPSVVYEDIDWMLHSPDGFYPERDPGPRYFVPSADDNRSSWPG